MRRLHLPLWAGIAAAAFFLGGLITHSLPVPSILQLPPAALLAVIGLIAALPMLITRWRVTLAIFFSWMMFEDLIRKLAGNDLRVYFVKDFIYIIVLIGMLADPAVRGSFRAATERSRLALWLLVTWAIVMTVPSFLTDWRLGVLGLRLDFFYVPLVAAGWLLASDKRTLRRALIGLSVIGALASGVGVIQAVVGPTFLAPSVATPGLDNLVTIRTSAGVANGVYRPTGPFVDPGRYAALAAVTIAVSLGAFIVTRRWLRAIALLCAGVAAAGVWVSGGRSTFLLGATLVAVAVVAPAYAERRPTISRAIPVAVVALLAMVMIALIVPGLFTNRVAWYQSTLSPGAPGSEWTSRWEEYSGNTFKGIAEGGLIGQGTGSQSVGKQYLQGGATDSSAGLFAVEAGYGSIAVEWGIIGLTLWLFFTGAWLTRLVSRTRAARPDPMAAVGIVLTAWIFIFLVIQFFSGLPIFQNYITNAYFWFLSGCVFALPVLVRNEQGDDAEPSPPALEGSSIEPVDVKSGAIGAESWQRFGR